MSKKVKKVVRTTGKFTIHNGSREFTVRYNRKGDMIISPQPSFPIVVLAARMVESRLLETNRQTVFSLPEA